LGIDFESKDFLPFIRTRILI